MTSPLAISIIWAVYNAIPPALVLFYAAIGKGVLLQYLCRFCMLLSFFCGATAIGLLWGLYPKEYNFNQVHTADPTPQRGPPPLLLLSLRSNWLHIFSHPFQVLVAVHFCT